MVPGAKLLQNLTSLDVIDIFQKQNICTMYLTCTSICLIQVMLTLIFMCATCQWTVLQLSLMYKYSFITVHSQFDKLDDGLD